MKKSFLWLLVGFVIMTSGAIYIAGCHSSSNGGFFFGSGTGGGASTFSKGVVNGTGNTIFVNGTGFTTQNAKVKMNGASGHANDLKLGQFVTVHGNAAGGKGAASSITFANDMQGPITSSTFTSDTVSTGTMTIFGQTVQIDGNTVIEPANLDLSSLATGSVVEVSGLPDGTGTLIATFINTKPSATFYNVRGMVSGVTGSNATTFTLLPNGNGNPLTVSLATGTTGTGLSSMGTGTGAGAGGGSSLITGGTGTQGLQNGEFVNVIIDPSTFQPGSTSITAKQVQIEPQELPAENDMVFLDGFASAPSGTMNTFMVDGIPVNPDSLQVPAQGTRIAVHGKFQNGVVMADMIQPAAGGELTIGTISAVSGTANAGKSGNIVSMVVNSTAFDISTATIMKNGKPATFADLDRGKEVIVKSAPDNFANVFTGATGTGLGTGGTGTLGSSVTGTGLDSFGTGTGLGSAGTNTNLGSAGTNTGAGAGGAALRLQKAIAVFIIDNMEGPLENLTGTLSLSTGTTGSIQTSPTATFTVFSQRISIDRNTVFSPAITSLGTNSLGSFGTGSVIDVSGMPDGMGDLLATWVGSKPTSTQLHVRGLVSGVTGSPVSTFTLTPVPGGTPLTVSLASNVTVSSLVDGNTVDVTVDPSFMPGATTLNATSVTKVKEPVPSENDIVNIEGLVSNLSGTMFTVNGIPVDMGSTPTTGFSNGSMVQVRGTASGGTIKANQITAQ